MMLREQEPRMVRPQKYTDDVVTQSISSNYGEQFESEIVEAVTPN